MVATRIEDKNFERADRRIGFGSVEMEFDRARVLEIGRLLFDGLARRLVHGLTDAPKKIAEFIFVVCQGFEERPRER